MAQRKRRFTAVLIAFLLFAGGAVYEKIKQQDQVSQGQVQSESVTTVVDGQTRASDALQTLEVKGRAPKTGYARSQFGNGWEQSGACDVRNHILKRDMKDVVTKSETDCTVMKGTLDDPYTAKTYAFIRGPETSDDIQIDHVVALSDAWQKGAQQLAKEERVRFANDSLNLLAVDGKTNNEKSDSDAATWLPPNKEYRCRYIARQVAVKQRYKLWVTAAERDAMSRILNTCPDQVLPVVGVVL